MAGINLACQYPNARIVFSGGNGNLVPTGETTEADDAEEVLVGFGLQRDRLLFDRQARNTRENAEFSKALAQPKPHERWLLVTSAFHMPRSIGIFHKIGFAVEPYPFDRQKGLDWPHVLTLNSTFVERVNQTDIAVHEWVGLIAYRLAGITNELLPSPSRAAHHL